MNNQLPKHIGFILDGNRRWAEERGLPTFTGHAKGLDRAREIINYSYDRGISVITMYCFSLENWSRTKREVNYLMGLFNSFIEKNINELHQKGVRLVHLGRIDEIPSKLAKNITKAVVRTKNNSKMVLQLALNYSGRDEIKRAIENIVNQGLELSVDSINKSLDSATQPDPDLIVRTSGEQRLSGFLIWQAAYAEFYFPKVHWPDFSSDEFDKAIAEYQSRKRRFGGN